jgi:hypothetical protein
VDIALRQRRGSSPRIRIRSVAVVVAVELFVIALTAALLILASPKQVSVGDPGAQGGPPVILPIPHPVPVPLGN